MNEQDFERRFLAYKEGLGSCSRAPARRARTSRRYLLLSPVGVAAAVAVGLLVWPKESAAAKLRRVGDAITNASTMRMSMYSQDRHGKWSLWTQASYSSGKWRNDYLINEMHTPVTMIFKNGLCYEYHGDLDYATIRPSNVAYDPPKLQGSALEVVERSLEDRLRGYEVGTSPVFLVQGKPAYQVRLERKDDPSRVLLTVDQATDLPISAEMSSPKTSEKTRWDYRFGKPVSDLDFNVPSGRSVVDLRKTIPAFLHSHQEPITAIPGLSIVDACVAGDGTVWIASLCTDKDYDLRPGSIECGNGEVYTRGTEAALAIPISPDREILVSAFTPVYPIGSQPLRDGTSSLPGERRWVNESQGAHWQNAEDQVSELLGSQGFGRRFKLKPGQSRGLITNGSGFSIQPRVCQIKIERSSRARALPDPGLDTGSEYMGTIREITVPLRSEHELYPSYFRQVGVEDDLPNIPFDLDCARSAALERLGQFGAAAPIWERVAARYCSPEYPAYRSWLQKASADYEKAGLGAEAQRVEQVASRLTGYSKP